MASLLLLLAVGAVAGDKLAIPQGGVDFTGCKDDGEGRCCVIKEELIDAVENNKVCSSLPC